MEPTRLASCHHVAEARGSFGALAGQAMKLEEAYHRERFVRRIDACLRRPWQSIEELEESMLTKGIGGALAVGLIMAIGPALAQGTRVTLTFTPESKTPAFEAAAAEYRAIWEAEGVRVIAAMERLTRLRFPQKNIKIQVFEGASNSGLLFNSAGVPVRSRDPDAVPGELLGGQQKGRARS